MFAPVPIQSNGALIQPFVNRALMPVLINIFVFPLTLIRKSKWAFKNCGNLP